MNPHEYLRLQLRLEGKEFINGNLLRQVEAVPGEDMPLMILVQFANQEIVTYLDEALQADLRKELTKLTCDVNFPGIDSLLSFLRNQNISFDTGYYKTYLFPTTIETGFLEAKCLCKQDVLVRSFGFADFAEDVYVIEYDKKIVSACVSVRENVQCGEAWVYTDPQYRNRGFAQQVVNAWAHHMIKSGKIPFYSHAIYNIASANLAKQLGLQPVFEEVCISYKNV